VSAEKINVPAFAKINLGLRVHGRRPDGYHDLRSLVVSLGQPHDVLEAFAVPAPGGVQLEVGGVEVGEDVPADHRNLAFIAAEKLLPRPAAARGAVAAVLLALGLGVALAPADVPGFAEPDGGMHGGGGGMRMMP
jgi:4-diphosphocytidyl-2-C-methyl-D-erythritol kinase